MSGNQHYLLVTDQQVPEDLLILVVSPVNAEDYRGGERVSRTDHKNRGIYHKVYKSNEELIRQGRG